MNQSKEQPIKGWVKASADNLPKKRGKYFIRYMKNGVEIRTGSLFDGWKFPYHKTEIEWLDETPIQSGEERLFTLKEAIQIFLDSRARNFPWEDEELTYPNFQQYFKEKFNLSI